VEGANVPESFEDIVDSGVTLSYLMQVLQQRKAARLGAHRPRLLDKPEAAAASGSRVTYGRIQDPG